MAAIEFHQPCSKVRDMKICSDSYIQISQPVFGPFWGQNVPQHLTGIKTLYGLRQKDQTTKAPTGPFKREELLDHLEKQAKEFKDREDLVPYTGEKRVLHGQRDPGGGGRREGEDKGSEWGWAADLGGHKARS
ncbi:hypothetical protein P7K49_001405 [Saguinus oedipus]|uniref:Uncharacterized protein n=1 Tax=Saguinus oedipus TaxID=9490 RepID=A0ABQ9WEF7_SAGOE|nr:hypothetical protein P7K49_001405 [Saguinus oedipus]